ncbi:MAG TPA: transglycosylase SLT domain-containing protein [Halioglobus sp.]
MSRILLLLLLVGVSACTTSPPRDIDNICAIFQEKEDWYDDAADAQDAWGSAIPVMMAIIYQESRFQAEARPPRKMIFGVIPWLRPSSAYGYSQAKTTTWDEYQHDAGRFGADRNDFANAIDFVGWYNQQSQKRCAIPLQNTYGLYLAYHEGHGGYNRATYLKNASLMTVARKVESRANNYQAQLINCESKLERSKGFFDWF